MSATPPIAGITGQAPRTLLITGGAGFIGSGLARRFVEAGDRVVVLDNLSTGFAHNVPDGATLIAGDVGDRELVQKVFAGWDFDVVLHLAAQVSNIVSHADPWLDFQTNVAGTLNVLESVVARRVPRLMYASSMALYGTPDRTPTGEEAPLRPLSPYGVSKLAAEHLVHNTARRSDLDFDLSVTSMRMFNVYGPNQSLENPYQGVVSVFIANVMAGEPITLFGDGLQSRDFVYIDDILDGWMAALDAPEARGRRINLGSGEESSINALIDAVLAGFGRGRDDYPVVRKPTLPGDQRSIRADVSRARELLGWEPRWSLMNGLAETISWALPGGDGLNVLNSPGQAPART